jgi:peptidoglycan hydrolase CwlO-like protein
VTIDERLEALTQNLELLSHDIEAEKEKIRRLDERERRARAALMAGIAAYLQALAEDDDGEA